jgi:hypothetical protein
MKTIRVKVGIHKNQEPRTPDEIPDLTVKKLEEIKMANELGYKTYLYNIETNNDFEKWFEYNNSVRNNGI